MRDAVRVSDLRTRLERVDRAREQIAKAWLVDVILNSPLADVDGMPMGWATGELPQLISDVLGAAGSGPRPKLDPAQRERAAHLAELRAGRVAPAQLSAEIAALHETLLASLRDEFPDSDAELFREASERLAVLFGEVSGAAQEALFAHADGSRDPVTGLHRPGALERRLEQLVAAQKRYGHPFAVVLFDVEGPGSRGNGNGHGALNIVSGALRRAIRIVDEAFVLEDDELCVLAPNLASSEATRMAERVAQTLADLEANGGLPISISAGVVACPEHGDDPARLLRQADSAMWRARATGRAVTVGSLQDR